MKIKKYTENLSTDSEQELTSLISDLIHNEVEMRQVRYSDDYEISYESIERASREIVKFLIREYNFKMNLDAKKYNI